MFVKPNNSTGVMMLTAGKFRQIHWCNVNCFVNSNDFTSAKLKMLVKSNNATDVMMLTAGKIKQKITGEICTVC